MDLRFLKLFLGLIFLFGYSTRVIWAHGGGTPQLTNAEAGPYLVSVWTQPEPLRVGEAHFTVAVSEQPISGAIGEAGPPVLNAVVELQLKPMAGGGKTVVASATHEAAINKLFYEADVGLAVAGQWQVVVSVTGPAGPGETGFAIEVLPPSTVNGWILGGGLGMVLLAASWIVFKGLVEKH